MKHTDVNGNKHDDFHIDPKAPGSGKFDDQRNPHGDPEAATNEGRGKENNNKNENLSGNKSTENLPNMKQSYIPPKDENNL